MTDDLAARLRSLADERPPLDDSVIAAGIRRGHSAQRRRQRITAGVAIAGVVAAIGLTAWLTRAGDPAPAPTPDPVDGLGQFLELDENGEPLVSCGGEGWSSSIMAQGIPGLLSEEEARETFQRILDDPRTGGEAELSLFRDGIDVEWRVLAETSEGLVLGLGTWTEEGQAPGSMVLSLKREGDHWFAGGWGDCGLQPTLRPGNAWVQLHEYRAESSEATAVQVSLSEQQCTSSRDPDPYLHQPVVEERSDAVVVYWTTTPFVGGADCAGNPVVTRTMELEEPLGTRQILDGSVYPPQPVPRTVTNPVGVAYGLSTHCGIDDLRYQGVWYERVGGRLDNGNGNAPEGWDDPVQEGWLAKEGDRVVFTDGFGHREEFNARPGAERPKQICQ